MEIRFSPFVFVLLILLTACGGNSTSTGTVSDTTPPVVSAVTVSGVNTQGQVTLDVTASDDVRPTGYCFKTDSATPSATDACFTAVPRSGFITIQKDSQTYFVWAKDAADHVSTAFRVVIEGDTLSPTLSVMPAISNGMVTLIATASDNKAVAGYCFKTDEAKPAASDPCFTAATKYTVELRNPSQLYHVWAKDFAGNISSDMTRYVRNDTANYADCVSLVQTVTLQSQSNLPIVCVSTSLGNFVVELEDQKAPKTVANFLQYVKDGFYSGTNFHRIISTFVVQGGGYISDTNELKKTYQPIPLETTQKTGLSHLKGTLAMARGDGSDTGTSQFFVNVVDNIAGKTNNLDYQSADKPGYAVFGRVIYGMDDAIEKIRQVPIATGDTPIAPPIIYGAYQLR